MTFSSRYANAVAEASCVRASAKKIRVQVDGNRNLQFCEIGIRAKQNPAEDGSYPSNSETEARAFDTALELFTIAPEFHATNKNKRTVVRKDPEEKK